MPGLEARGLGAGGWGLGGWGAGAWGVGVGVGAYTEAPLRVPGSGVGVKTMLHSRKQLA